MLPNLKIYRKSNIAATRSGFEDIWDDWWGFDDDWPNIGGGGNLSPVNVAPKAKKIFRNSNMTEENWKNIERMLEKIMEECMGEALYNGLSGYLNGNTLTIEFVPDWDSEFTVNGSHIKIGMKYAQSNVLFHEMFHAYQAYNETLSSFRGSTLNIEFEAHYAQYLYLKSLPEYKNSDWEKGYEEYEHLISVGKLEKYIDEKGKLRNGVTVDDLMKHIEDKMITAFQGDSEYGIGYPYDSNRKGLSNFSNLNTITKGC